MNTYADRAKEKLFKQLVKDLNKEFKDTGDKLIKKHGTSQIKTNALQVLNDTVAGQVTKKMEAVDYRDAEKVSKQFVNISKNVNKEAKKADIILKNADQVAKTADTIISSVGAENFSSFFNKFTGSKEPEQETKSNKKGVAKAYSTIMVPVKDSLERSTKLVDKYALDVERIDTMYNPSSWLVK